MPSQGMQTKSATFFFLSTQECHLYLEVKANQWPLVYSQDYNIGFLGLERLHPFDSGKWGKVFQYLKGTDIVWFQKISIPIQGKSWEIPRG